MNYDEAKDIMREYFQKLLEQQTRYITEVAPIMIDVIKGYQDIVEYPESFKAETTATTKQVFADKGTAITEGTEEFKCFIKSTPEASGNR